MKQLFFLSFFFLVYESLIMGCAVVFHVQEVPLSIAPLILAYALFLGNPFHSMVIVITMGCLMDLLHAGPFGLNAFVLLILWFLGEFVTSSLSQSNPLFLGGMMICASLLYRILIALFIFLFASHSPQVTFFSFFLAPLLDALSAIFLLDGVRKWAHPSKNMFS